MKLIRLLLLMSLLASGAWAQNYTSVIATNITTSSGAKLRTGKLCFTATDGTDTTINYQVGGGGQVIIKPVCTPVVNGAIGVFSIANSDNTIPVGVLFRIDVLDPTGVVLTYKLTVIHGASFNLDTYIPPVGPISSGISVPSLTVGALNVSSCAGNGCGHTIQSAGVSLTTRSKLNFLGTMSCVDNNSTSATDCTGISSLVRIANNAVGGDLGAQANAQDTALGASPGEIWVFPTGAPITTQIVVTNGHNIKFFPGTYTNALGDRTPLVRLQDNTTMLCAEKMACIVQESSNGVNTNPVIVCAYYMGVNCNSLAGTTTNIHVSWMRFQGANATGTSLIDSVSLGNCVNCSVKDNWFDNIKSSHILVGGTSGSGNFANHFEVSGNIVSGEQNCSICIINGDNVDIHDNFSFAHGNGAAAIVDVEPNSTTDYAQHIDIHNNTFDESAAINSVFCVTIQNGPFVNMGIIKVHDNLCSGGPFTSFGTAASHLITCYGSGPGPVNTISDVEIYNNTCRVTIQDGISMVGTNRGYIHDNIVECAGGNAITLAGNVTNSVVERNRVLTVTSPTSCGQNSKGRYVSSIVAETNAGNANNIFRDNIATASIVNGAGSRVITTDLPDGSARSFGVPVGFESGILGSFKVAPVGQVTNIVSVGGAVPGCVLSPQQNWFYKITAVTPYGEGPASGEITAFAGGGSGCPTFTWNKVAGATSYKLYRGATTGTEGFIATISGGGVVIGSDDGTATAGAAPPTTDSTAVLGGIEGAAPSGIASSDLLWADSTGHCWTFNNNNGGNSGCIPGIGLAQSWTGKQSFVASATTASLNLTGVGSDPSSLSAGDVWYRSDLGRLRVRDASTVHSSMWTDDLLAIAQTPLTTRGDLLTVNSGGALSRLGIGGSNTLLHGGSDPSYSAVAIGDVTGSTGTGNFVFATSPTVTDLTVNQAANNDNLFFGQRATDSSPTGNLVYFKNQANNADLFKLDVTGKLTMSEHFLAINGTSSLPGISFSANTDTGLTNNSGSVGVVGTSGAWTVFNTTGLQHRSGDCTGWSSTNTIFANGSDIAICRDGGAGILAVKAPAFTSQDNKLRVYSSSGGYEEYGTASELITLSTSGTTTDSVTNLLPANSIIGTVDCRVTTTITTATNWSVGDATIAARFSAANSTLTLGTTSVGLQHVDQTGTSGPKQTSASKLRITTTGTPGAGAIRCVVHYTLGSPPTS